MSELSAAHRRELEAGSGISPEIIAEMGAWTATTKAQLVQLGFKQEDIKPAALVLPVLTWAGGETPAYYRIKPDAPRINAKDKPRKYEQPVGVPCRVYCLPTARRRIEGLQGLADRPMPALPYVFVTEGEKKAAALVSQGLTALSVPGVWNFKNLDALRGDWDLIGLRGLSVCVLFDSDVATNPQVRMAENRLAEMLRAMGAKVYACRLPAGPNGEKTGADDFFIQGGSVEELESLVQEHEPEKADVKPSTTESLILLGRQLGTYWRDSDGEAFATVPLASGGRENLLLRSVGFREWLAGEAYKKMGRALPREAIDRTIETLAAQAKYGDGGIRMTARRVGHAEGAVFVDLCDRARRIIRVTADGWGFVPDDACPVHFIRPRHAGALPDPTLPGNSDRLRDLLSLDADGLCVVESFLLGAFMPPPGGFPILVATGEQGSGKSFGCRVLRRLVDPATPELRTPPRDERDLGAALDSGYMLAFDNLAGLPVKLSNSLCALATGGGIAARKLYTDSEEHVITGRRPVLLNGINDPTSAPDLAERSLFIHFARPEGRARKTESELEAIFTSHAGSILGAILDRVSRALRDRERVQPPGALPRMADFAAWVHAGTPDADRRDVWRVLADNRWAKSLASVEEDALASAVRKLAESGEFTGTAMEMLAALNEQERITVPKDRPEGWPTSADALGRRLRKIAPVLRAVGIEIRQERGKARIWRIGPKCEEQSDKSVEVSGAKQFELKNARLRYDTFGHGSDEATLPFGEVSKPPGSDSNLDGAINDAFDTSTPTLAERGNKRRRKRCSLDLPGGLFSA